MGNNITIVDIARESGVSIATVSRVLSGSGSVKASTREKVEAVVDRYGYAPNMIAASLNNRKSRAFGIVLPFLDNPYYSRICIAAQNAAQHGGYSALLYQMAKGTAIPRQFIDILIGRRLDGVLFSGDVMDATSLKESNAQVLLLQRHMPVVIINPLTKDTECARLMNDLCGATVACIRHFRTLGHEKIALLGGDGFVLNDNSRETGYLDGMRNAGLEKFIYPFTVGQTASEGETALAKLLSIAKERPTALICYNDLVAMGAMRKLREMGVSVPDEMAVSGCDDLFFAPYMTPPLTSVDLRAEEMATYAMNSLIEAQRRPLDPFSKTFECRLMVRESCGVGLNTGTI